MNRDHHKFPSRIKVVQNDSLQDMYSARWLLDYDVCFGQFRRHLKLCHNFVTKVIIDCQQNLLAECNSAIRLITSFLVVGLVKLPGNFEKSL